MLEKIRPFILPFSRAGINKLDGQILGMFIRAVDEVMRLFQEEDIPVDEASQLLACSHIFANMVAITPYKTTDQWLTQYQHDPVKQMFLYSAYNSTRLDAKVFFDYDVQLASLWFVQYIQPVIGCVSETIQNNVETHFRQMDKRCVFLPQSTHAFFWSDYFYPSISKQVKKQFNQSIEMPVIVNQPNKRKVAIVTGNWKPTHAVVRSVGQIAYALATKYDLTLVHLGPLADSADLSIFECVKQVTIENDAVDLSEIMVNDFGAALFLDIGLTPESIYLSNARIAPIQMTCLGHPASGRGNKIDYFITGDDVESLADYTETLIRVPGSGAFPRLPEYTREYLELGCRKRVAVPWSAIKYNIPMFEQLRQLQKYGAHLVFLPGSPIHRYQASIPVRMAMLEYFGKDITIMPNLTYIKYMQALESCHFSLDSHPFGGYNTVLESLWCGRPVVALEGNEWFNRAASYLLKRAGMADLVASTYRDYLETAKRLLLDPEFYDNMSQRANRVDFSHLVGADNASEFFSAIDTVISQRYQNE